MGKSPRILQKGFHNLHCGNPFPGFNLFSPGFLIASALIAFLLTPINGHGQIASLSKPGEKVSLSNFTTNQGYSYPDQPALSQGAFAKEANDTSIAALNKAAKSTALKSLVIPGWGQVENGQVWKVPILYAGLGACAYAISFNHSHYKEFAKAYRLRTDGDSTTVDKFDPETGGAIIESNKALRDSREFYRRNRTLSYIVTGVVWAANILDAYVFAHLKEFDVSEDLSMKVNPPNFANIASRNHITMGISLKLKP